MTTYFSPRHLFTQPKNAPLFAQTVNGLACPDPRAIRALLLLMNQHAVTGGAAAHWGGPSALAETLSALHALSFARATEQNKDWQDIITIVNDAGHCENAFYATQALYQQSDLTLESLKTFRSLNSPLTGHGEAHLNPRHVLVSNGPLGSSLPQALGLAFGRKLRGETQHLTLCLISDGACMEGEAREALAALPGLAAKGKLAPFITIISDNNTKLGGRIDSDSYSMAPTFDSLEKLGHHVIKVEEAHNLDIVLETLSHAWDLALKSSRPICLWLKTEKGHGLKASVHMKSGGHGHHIKSWGTPLEEAIAELYAPHVVPSLFTEWMQKHAHDQSPKSIERFPGIAEKKVQVGISEALIEARSAGLPLYSLSADLASSTGLSSFQQKFPEAFYDIGISESLMVSMASGLAQMGAIPVVDTFAQFGVTKGLLPLTMAQLSLAPVIALFSHAGLQDAADGASHQASTYLAAVSALPHCDVIVCAYAEHAKWALGEGIKRYAAQRAKGPEHVRQQVYFYGRENFPENIPGTSLAEARWGEAIMVKAGHPGAGLLVATGPMLFEAFSFAERLEKSTGICVSIIHHAFVNHFVPAQWSEWLKLSGGNIVTMEDHQIIGGMGQMLAHSLSSHEYTSQLRILSLGLQESFGRSAYSASMLYEYFDITSEKSFERVSAHLAKKP
jgi:transketolase